LAPRKQLENSALAVAPTPSDFRFENHGSIGLLRPITAAAKAWVKEHIGQNNGYQPMWPTVLIDPRYCEAILEGIAADGLGLS
jgi:hypothetical protein